jgi:large subunit ribosomal protein L30
MPRKEKSEAAKAKTKAAVEKNTVTSGVIRIQYYRSFIATPKTHKQIVRSVGLTKLNQIVNRPDTPSMRGVVAKVPHLLRIIE